MKLPPVVNRLPKLRGRAALLAAAVGGLLLAAAATAVTSCDPAGVSAPVPTARAQAPTPTPPPTERGPTATPGPLPTVVLPPGGEPPSGGDRPVGPPPAPRVGYLPENVGVSPEFMALQRTLQREIDAYLASTGTRVALAVTDLQTSQTISVRGNVTQRTGCTIHLFALLAITSEFQAGRGDPANVAASVRVGIGNSYPPQVRAFLDTVFGDFHRGEQRGRDLMASWGMSASLFDHVAYYGDGTQNNLLTTLETNLALTKLYRGQLFDPEWTGYALARLREISPGLNYIIPGQLPAQASVAHKIGYYADVDGWVVADAGIVTFADSQGRQRAYAITYLSERAPSEYAGYSFGAHLSRIVWDWMEPRYRDGVPPTDVPTRTPRPTNTRQPTWTPRPTSTPPAPAPTASPTVPPTGELITPIQTP